MPRQRKKSSKTREATAANVGYEAQLWRMADALRGSMDAAEYKHVVLDPIFLKHISDAFEEAHTRLEAERAQRQLVDDAMEGIERDNPTLKGVRPEDYRPCCDSGGSVATFACSLAEHQNKPDAKRVLIRHSDVDRLAIKKRRDEPPSGWIWT